MNTELFYFIPIILVHDGKTGNDPDPGMKSTKFRNMETIFHFKKILRTEHSIRLLGKKYYCMKTNL